MTTAVLANLEVHPVADMFPMLTSAELAELAESIAANGLLEPIVVFEGKLVDGRNRLAACEVAGVEPDVVDYPGEPEGLVSWIMAKNLDRRHLTPSQRAMLGARLATLAKGHRPRGERSQTPTQRQAAELVGVGERSIRRARQVLESGDEELVAQVDQGQVAVSAAAQRVKPPVRVQTPAPDDRCPARGTQSECELCPKDDPWAHHFTPTRLGDEIVDISTCIHCGAVEPVEAKPKGRARFDAYYTPEPHARACVRWLAEQDLFRGAGRVLEPSVGDGAWARAVRKRWPDSKIDALDLDPGARGLKDTAVDASTIGDFRRFNEVRIDDGQVDYDLIVGNPPYDADLILPWLSRSLRMSRVVAYLLRETITGTDARLSFWLGSRPAWICKVVPRPKWEGPGARDTADFADSVLIVWVRDSDPDVTRWDWIDAGSRR